MAGSVYMTLGTTPIDRDPLEHFGRRRVVVAATVALGIGVFIASILGARPDKLPGVALESLLLLHLERSIVAASAVAGLPIFVLRGWAGYFPSKLSTGGAEYAERSAVDQRARSGDEILGALADMEARQLVLAKALRDSVRAVERSERRDGEGGDQR